MRCGGVSLPPPPFVGCYISPHCCLSPLPPASRRRLPSSPPPRWREARSWGNATRGDALAVPPVCSAEAPWRAPFPITGCATALVTPDTHTGRKGLARYASPRLVWSGALVLRNGSWPGAPPPFAWVETSQPSVHAAAALARMRRCGNDYGDHKVGLMGTQASALLPSLSPSSALPLLHLQRQHSTSPSLAGVGLALARAASRAEPLQAGDRLRGPSCLRLQARRPCRHASAARGARGPRIAHPRAPCLPLRVDAGMSSCVTRVVGDGGGSPVLAYDNARPPLPLRWSGRSAVVQQPPCAWRTLDATNHAAGRLCLTQARGPHCVSRTATSCRQCRPECTAVGGGPIRQVLRHVRHAGAAGDQAE